MTITINDKLADYYFGERPWDPIDRWVFKGSSKNRFEGYSYLIKVKFSNGIAVSDVFTVKEQTRLEKIVEAGKNATKITEGQSVGFAVRLRNDSPKAVNGTLSFFAAVPEENSERLVLLNRKTVTLNPDENVVIQVGNVTYLKAGTYEYFATFSFKGMEVKDSGSVEVTRLVLQKNLAIKGLQIFPANPEEHDDVVIIVYPYYVYSFVPDSVAKNTVFRNNFGPDALVPVSVNSEQEDLELSVVVRDVKTSSLVFGNSVKLDSGNIKNIDPFYVFRWRNAKAGDYEVTVGLIRGTEVLDKKTVYLHISEGDDYTGRFLTGGSQANHLTVTQGTFLNITLAADYYGKLKNEYVPITVRYTYQSPRGIFYSGVWVFNRNGIKFNDLPLVWVGNQYAFEFRDWFGLHFNDPGMYYLYFDVNNKNRDVLTVNTTPGGPVWAWMECNSQDNGIVYVGETGNHLYCTVYVKNDGPVDVPVRLTKVMLGGYEIWGEDRHYDAVDIDYVDGGLTGMTVKRQSMGHISVHVDLSKLSEEIYGRVDYKYLFYDDEGKPLEYMVSVGLQLGNKTQNVGQVVTMIPVGIKKDSLDYLSIGLSVIGGIITVISFVLVLSFGLEAIGVIVLGLGIAIDEYRTFSAPPRICSLYEGDNNLICGG
ncbi:hypothetical protein [Thermococcus sp. AM4]|uniref:hypothetical protein n=1 Tax=Thermococcus sp. (strain AM4) TaxID=246969 RepID=UPI000187127F|nr:hypothetical protein [Thermococcus sp. AM4]EEB73726.1 conserved hypothetical protein [Thermococcus sp. AM4]